MARAERRFQEAYGGNASNDQRGNITSYTRPRKIAPERERESNGWIQVCSANLFALPPSGVML
jgi:hypothetical protein